MAREKSKSLMHNLGQFFGHIAKGVKTDPAKPKSQTHEVRREVEEREETTPDGRTVTVRRTTVEEVEIREADQPKKPAEGPDS